MCLYEHSHQPLLRRLFVRRNNMHCKLSPTRKFFQNNLRVGDSLQWQMVRLLERLRTFALEQSSHLKEFFLINRIKFYRKQSVQIETILSIFLIIGGGLEGTFIWSFVLDHLGFS